MAKQINLMEASKVDWHVTVADDVNSPGNENIKIGCLQRIAKATEAMAVNHIQLQKEFEQAQKERDRYRSWYYEQLQEKRDMERSISALRGVVTRLKNQRKKEVTHG